MGSRAGHDVLRDARVSRSVGDSRPSDSLITKKLESVWPDVSERLAAMLRRRGVSPHDSDEAIQETAARAMTSGVDFIDADDLFRWACVVSWRVAIDARRRRSRAGWHEVPERADRVDVAQAAEHRIVLSAVTTRFKELSASDRAVLLASFDDQAPPSRLESVRTAVARHRARNRLRALLNGLATPALALLARRRGRSSHVEAFVSTTAPALACFTLAVTGVAGFSAPAGMQSALTTPAPVVVVARSSPSPLATAPLAIVAPTSPTSSATTTRVRGVTAGAHVAEPGHSTDLGTRPREADDHLVCATLPSLTGPSTTCVDPPTLGR